MIRLLGEICTFQAGGAFPQDEQGNTSGDYPFAKVRDLATMVGSEWREISNWIAEDQRQNLKAKIVPPGATVFAKIGEGLKNERLAITPTAMLIDNNMMAAVPNETHVNKLWFHYKVKTLGLSQFAVGSALPYLKQTDLQEIAIDVPELKVQQGIAEALGAFDDKIAANCHVTEASDRLAHALFARQAGRGQRVPLSSLAAFVNGGAFTRDATGSGRLVVRIAELNNGPSNSSIWNDLDVPEEKLVRPGDLLMSWSGSLTSNRWFRDESIVNQHIFKVIPTDSNPLWAVSCAVESAMDGFRDIAADKATTMGHIKRKDLDTLVSWPDFSDQEHALGATLWQRALAAEREILSALTRRGTRRGAVMRDSKPNAAVAACKRASRFTQKPDRYCKTFCKIHFRELTKLIRDATKKGGCPYVVCQAAKANGRGSGAS